MDQVPRLTTPVAAVVADAEVGREAGEGSRLLEARHWVGVHVFLVLKEGLGLGYHGGGGKLIENLLIGAYLSGTRNC